MTQQSAYTGISGYSCKEIDKTAYRISRKKLILDPYDMPKKKQHPGQVVNFDDRTADDILSRQKTLGGETQPSSLKLSLRAVMAKQQLPSIKPVQVTQGAGKGSNHAPRYTSEKSIEKYLLRQKRS